MLDMILRCEIVAVLVTAFQCNFGASQSAHDFIMSTDVKALNKCLSLATIAHDTAWKVCNIMLIEGTCST